jgi:hypothetical protein
MAEWWRRMYPRATRTQQARLSKFSRGKSLSGQKDGFSTTKHNPAFGLPLNVDACNDRNHIINVFDSNIIKEIYNNK